MSKYKHSLELEQRMFHLDVEALKQRFPEISGSLDGRRSEEPIHMSIELGELFKIAPRRRKAVKQYKRLQKHLADRGVELKITSRKTKRLVKEADGEVSSTQNTNILNNDSSSND